MEESQTPDMGRIELAGLTVIHPWQVEVHPIEIEVIKHHGGGGQGARYEVLTWD